MIRTGVFIAMLHHLFDRRNASSVIWHAASCASPEICSFMPRLLCCYQLILAAADPLRNETGRPPVL
jgi:hypothetical protein